ncbi:UvrD-helicase domain-containing protein [Caballeronia zhejiangensis]|uniref:UvrD-helicase domain-containing protein n=1 Tax=Caballeronia zhejiangensis TaxID=871203 RepID=UPI000A58D8D5|nr:UvrD-helicase domain-containing protein [Caballeronia zhejiangensis]
MTFYPGHRREIKADGLPNAQAASLSEALETALFDKRTREDVAHIQGARQAISQWLDSKAAQEVSAKSDRRWFTSEMQTALIQARPTIDAADVRARMQKPAVKAFLAEAAGGIEGSLDQWAVDHRTFWASLNAAHTERELVDCKNLFDKVESKPLTEEQSRAVICFDNRVQVVASAGSGKTSTMVAKAAYAIDRGIVAPERIVLLAFNESAAEELEERTTKSFERLGMIHVSVRASTFHALGLGIIGKATGQKPDIPDWTTDTTAGFRKLTQIIDELKDASPSFRTNWDMFRCVTPRDLQTSTFNGNDRWDTINGKRVRSQEELFLANWLFFNGVNYRYEEQYRLPTADEDHRQYRPDFYYPDVDLYHEHFALDADGKAPAHFSKTMLRAWSGSANCTRSVGPN